MSSLPAALTGIRQPRPRTAALLRCQSVNRLKNKAARIPLLRPSRSRGVPVLLTRSSSLSSPWTSPRLTSELKLYPWVRCLGSGPRSCPSGSTLSRPERPQLACGRSHRVFWRRLLGARPWTRRQNLWSRNRRTLTLRCRRTLEVGSIAPWTCLPQSSSSSASTSAAGPTSAHASSSACSRQSESFRHPAAGKSCSPSAMRRRSSAV
mmetsp:Transcript_17000/g.40066  ORF Transcript_17000/g.40066 Transcript_17000/m.40066 type:complete len:207 (+) Transcript_17000:677-1297(+)